ncbi:MAG TPA: fatty acid cis/trans isomerase [Candidatus Accumulibacter phosphatis]|nr:MAG: Fatty acid cis/trans isomerase (CTI) [Candidatus Accumulibacter sp. SK-11]HAY27607.1 peptidylprolyl isomerase [Accumulibacter sp.]HCN69629.1 peptidylprolyl isomerase [Accumulibacter sp.]HRL77684.1 fatty acid cis/trans isomerase [Candidatus Accumulibacter phosphatis]HRQ96005.1 fatty acid cis/trans isomerase [Candidatus Accumulibacter phosphatis]
MTINKTPLLLLIAVLSGCAAIARHTLDQQYGAADPQRFDAPPAAARGLSYRADVQPILDRRCVVCHACYDAPCQLKLGAWEGVARGASDELVYDGGRLQEAAPSRLFVDAGTASAWRAQGFFPVLNERQQTPAANLAASVFYRALQLKHSHPLPATAVLPQTFDFSLDRAQQCPRIEDYDSFAASNPLWGMPFGLPGLSDVEFATLRTWLQQGAPFDGLPPLPATVERQVADWERFLNGDSLKERLVSRYIYEHLFLAHLYFDTDPQHHFFRLIRSRTPPGEPSAVIASRRPYDDPGSERFYYRLERERESIVDKTHMPYALGEKRMARWRELFLQPAYRVDALPPYSLAAGANPFLTFRDLPVRARYQFLLDEAEFTIMGFIKGPVCRGQVALNVIEDRFWVFFLANDGSGQAADEFLERESRFLELPSAAGSDAGILKPWREYAKKEQQYLRDKSLYLSSQAEQRGLPGLQLIWDGEGGNPNAALTVFRHFDSASVVRGLVGEPPKTAWVIGYPLLERIHYLLVAGFDVYGNVGHQLLSRLYMDFMRMEAEFNFLGFLPREQRTAVRDYWYRGASDEVREHVYGTLAWLDVDSGIRFRSGDSRLEFLGLLRQRLAPVADRRYDLAGLGDAALQADLAALAGLRGAALSWLPEVALLRIDDGERAPLYVTLLRNTGHSNVSSLLREGRELLPEENTLTVARGFVGAYPNAIYRVPRRQVRDLARAIGELASEDDYRALADRFAVRRTDTAFWHYSDELQATHLRLAPVTAGLLDYNRLENR